MILWSSRTFVDEAREATRHHHLSCVMSYNRKCNKAEARADYTPSIKCQKAYNCNLDEQKLKVMYNVASSASILPWVWDDALSHELDDHVGCVGDDEDDDHGEGEVGGLLLGAGHVGHLAVTRQVHTDGRAGARRLEQEFKV